MARPANSKRNRQKKKHLNYSRKTSAKKKAKRRRKQKVGPHEEIRKSWDPSKSLKENYDEMGLVLNVNASLPLQTGKVTLEPMEVEHGTKKKQAKKRPRERAAERMELDLKRKEAERAKVKTYLLPEPEYLWLQDLLDQYGEETQKMARDPKNHYQLTPKQIQRKINQLKNIPDQWARYLKHRNSLPSMNEDGQVSIPTTD
ncbi:unnamed protein product [Darwinula stevensoni]|uniref:Nucleolar protein 16 n=1 Tax=Darwinula stevensoni TaxID=69355 RepID=A0A7R9A866_9CRUS|nr:unnamed protein product [Darwinula stevensoni]CAG0895871.1 unnamed protein product [Darwinula stevensoni]